MIIEIKGLEKKFGDFAALKGISLSIKEREIFGILGPNGAGKTTTINLLLGLLKPTKGSIIIEGMDTSKELNKIKQTIGFMTQETVVDADLTAYENLEIAGRLYQMYGKRLEDAIWNALKEANLENFAFEKAGTFSGGMQRRLLLVKSMIHNPHILVLDEPTTGLDIQSRFSMWKHIKELNERGVTIILTTQYLEEADQLCNRIAIIDHGQIKAIGTPSQLKKSIAEQNMLELIVDASSVNKALKALEKIGLKANASGENIKAPIEGKDEMKRVIAELEKEKIEIISISMHLPTLDDVFIKLTGESMRDKVGEMKSNRSMAFRRR
ncbi:MAG: ATP-binding cassette domain-containing protein [Candidatus Micrarchaeaceae archaeon]